MSISIRPWVTMPFLSSSLSICCLNGNSKTFKRSPFSMSPADPARTLLVFKKSYKSRSVIFTFKSFRMYSLNWSWVILYGLSGKDFMKSVSKTVEMSGKPYFANFSAIFMITWPSIISDCKVSLFLAS